MATGPGGDNPLDITKKMKNDQESNDTKVVAPTKMTYGNLLKPKVSTCNIDKGTHNPIVLLAR